MLRWCLSTVRTLGGHDGATYPRTFRLFSAQTRRTSRAQSAVCKGYGNAATSAGDPPEPMSPVVPTSSARSHNADDDNSELLALDHHDIPHMFRQGVSTNLIECHESVSGPLTIARRRTSSSAIDILRLILSQDNVISDRPYLRSPNTIRSLYYSAESGNQLGKLDSNMLSVLIGLFGSLSIDPQTSLVYTVPLASHFVGEAARRSHWALVLKVGKYKQQTGMTLQDSDRFWLMRAELAIAKVLNDSAHPEPLSDNAVSAILRARTHYHIIRRHSCHPEVHAAYLETLLDSRGSQFLDLAAGDLSFVLRTHPMCHPRLLDVLYRLVIQHGAVLSARSQDAIVSALWTRACRTDLKPRLFFDNGQPREGSDNCLVLLDATALARTLSTTLLGSPYHLPTSMNNLFPVFSPADTLPRRWTALILLSLFNASVTSYPNEVPTSSGRPIPLAASCWQVIFGLATVEKVLQQQSLSPLGSSSVPTQSILETAHTLYQRWLSVMEARLVSREVACAISASFFRLASVVADASFLDACRVLYDLTSGFEGPKTLVDNTMTAHYIAATLRVHGVRPDAVFRVLERFSSDLEQQPQVLAIAVTVLAAIDPPVARALYTIAHRTGREPGPEATHTLALSLARYGALEQTVGFFNDNRFSLNQRETLIIAIARRLWKDKPTRHLSSIFEPVANELLALYRSHHPPGHFRGHLELLLIVLCQHGKARQAIRVVSFIAQGSLVYFRPRFYVRLCFVLLRRRQLAIAARLVATLTATNPKVARLLNPVVQRTAIRARKSRVSQRTRIHSTSSPNNYLARVLGPNGSLNKVVRGPVSLRLSSFLRRSTYAGPWLERAIQELVNSRRVLAAEHVFARVSPMVLSKRCTALGNILLHGVSWQPLPRNGRRVRKILALLDELIKIHGFQPDRVTVNIVLKVMLSWRSMFDSRPLRALFDQFVRGGYPAAKYSPQHPPFGTPPMQWSNSLSLSKLPPFISFEKHSRPLFKMFIKAFYLRNDVEAARKVVGILKEEEHRNTVAKETRQWARSEGRIKALRHLGPPSLDTAVPTHH
ncbi:hypothetical protein PAXINDRAFT_169866 [Paxillus involutus ATCC 200175]|uniref:Uncharacterized protein n=1 Tax=Paxillus involutus ATCC 200175 TaxID=664439 RepID=A0A0C9U482_PAXIN|nr:hypothetical protein PAXINDRAFT_169866 [Paxillus involutus ATCC 200175]